MQRWGLGILSSASDVVEACACPVLPLLERARLAGELVLEPASDPEKDLVARQAALHEAKALEDFEQSGRQVVRIPEAPPDEAAEATEQAMAAGADAIYQGVLLDPPWLGRPDFLVRVDGASRFGPFRYEVLDAKLARHARSQALVQAAVYSLLLAKAQGAAPERLHLWLGSGRIETFRAEDFTAYAELARRRLLELPPGHLDAAPDRIPPCAHCRFLPYCDALRRQEDHLSLLPGIQGRQIRRLRERGITAVARLAQEDPEQHSPAAARLVHLARLPEPCSGDVFFDLEGDPFAPGGSLEYLWGWLVRDGDGWIYEHRWAHTPAEERAAFEAFHPAIPRPRPALSVPRRPRRSRATG